MRIYNHRRKLLTTIASIFSVSVACGDTAGTDVYEIPERIAFAELSQEHRKLSNHTVLTQGYVHHQNSNQYLLSSKSELVEMDESSAQSVEAGSIKLVLPKAPIDELMGPCVGTKSVVIGIISESALPEIVVQYIVPSSLYPHPNTPYCYQHYDW